MSTIRPKQSIPENVRWYVVGAHLAGAVDSQIVEMTSLSKGSIRQIIQNFKRTGSPSIARLPPPDDPYGETTDTDDRINEQDHKSKRRRGSARRFTASQVVQHILDETQEGDENSIPSDEKEWTREDDLILLQHAWTRFPRAGGRWHEAEAKLGGRHSAKECQDRWDVVRPVLMKSIERYGTEGW
ncbi:hypothetical protein BJV82DRAFT_615040 [Fennellomyces sp. T-0311]|nr:hypothetical protein BJV82DRAFT_615040 [Fennellomyces sp. T-0311]